MDYEFNLEDVADIIGDTIDGIEGWDTKSMRLDHTKGKEQIIIKLRRVPKKG